MVLIEHIQHDWSVRVPCLLKNNRYRGLSRPSYSLLCILFHLVKTAVLLSLFVCFRVLKFLFWDIWVYAFRKRDEDDYEFEDEEEEYEEDPEDEIEELPFCQLFRVGKEMSLLVDHVEMCPDETAFIRVIDDEGYTPLYKRKVRTDKNHNRFIVFSGQNYYLDDKRTQPTISTKK